MNKKRNRFTDPFSDDNINRIHSRRKRNIPVWVPLVIFFSKTIAIMGLVFTLLGGMVFLKILYPLALEQKDIDDNAPVVQAVITDIVPTSVEVNEEPMYEYHYEFETISGEKIKTKSKHFEGEGGVGDLLSVRYNPDNPQEACLDGVEENNTIKWVMLSFISFPLVGLVFIVLVVIDIVKKVRVMKNGEIVKGTYSHKKATGTMINNQRVYIMFFKFTAPDGREYQAKGKTHLIHRLDDEDELVIFNRQNPSNAFPIDILPLLVKRFLKKQNVS